MNEEPVLSPEEIIIGAIIRDIFNRAVDGLGLQSSNEEDSGYGRPVSELVTSVDPITGQRITVDSPTGQNMRSEYIQSLVKNQELLDLVRESEEVREAVFPDDNFIFEEDTNGNIYATNKQDIVVIDPQDGKRTRILDFKSSQDALIIKGLGDANRNSIAIINDGNSSNTALVLEGGNLIAEFLGISAQSLSSVTHY